MVSTLYFNNFAESLSFHPAPSSSQNVKLSDLQYQYKTNDIPICLSLVLISKC